MPGGTTQAAPGAARAHGRVAVFYRGADHRLWEESRTGKPAAGGAPTWAAT